MDIDVSYLTEKAVIELIDTRTIMPYYFYTE
jgi:hypothetical protein